MAKLQVALLVFLGFSLGLVSSLLLLNFGLITIATEIDVVDLANLLIVIVLTLAIPLFISPHTDYAKQSIDIAIGEINSYLLMVEEIRDWLCNLSNSVLTPDDYRKAIFSFKKLRQHLKVLEKEISRIPSTPESLVQVKENLNEFWQSGTDSIASGKRPPALYALINLESSTRLQISLKEVRFQVRNS
jgi:hypothetical protein